MSEKDPHKPAVNPAGCMLERLKRYIHVRKQQEKPRRTGFVLENKQSREAQAIREGGPQDQA